MTSSLALLLTLPVTVGILLPIAWLTVPLTARRHQAALDVVGIPFRRYVQLVRLRMLVNIGWVAPVLASAVLLSNSRGFWWQFGALFVACMVGSVGAQLVLRALDGYVPTQGIASIEDKVKHVLKGAAR